MFSQLRSVWMLTAAILQRLATVVFLLAALALSVATIGAATGHLPWLEFEVAIGGTAYPNAGELAQIALAALALPRCVYLPANARIMALDTSHRRFNMGMQDVARAYALAHSADRAGLFRLSSEFDAVRERLIYLRNHPNPSGLEQDLLEVAAQMSHVSQELADTCSDEKVARACAFLRQRQQEVETFNARLARQGGQPGIAPLGA